MQKRVIKDIQVRKKVTSEVKPTMKSFDAAPKIPKQSFIEKLAPERKPANPIESKIIVHDEIPPQIKPELSHGAQNLKSRIPESVTNTEFSTFEDQIYSYKPKKSINRKSRILSVVLIVALFVLVSLIYIITGTKLTITPKILDTSVNESITATSWTVPFKSTIMVIAESAEIEGTDEETKTILDEKIKNRMKYDMPPGYILTPGCKTSTYYETIEKEDKTKVIEAKVTSLLIEESGLKQYLIDSNKLANMEIKNMFGLDCELKTDITKYKIGDKTNNLAFILSGKIKTEYIIDKEEVASSVLGKSKNNARDYLNKQEGILNYVIKSKPFGFMPVIPKNPNHLEVVVESVL